MTGFKNVRKNNVAQMKAAVAIQPVCVGIEADKNVFQLYQHGILDSKKCGTKIDHAVTAVGYGSEGEKEYLIIRNSWGADWGE